MLPTGRLAVVGRGRFGGDADCGAGPGWELLDLSNRGLDAPTDVLVRIESLCDAGLVSRTTGDLGVIGRRLGEAAADRGVGGRDVVEPPDDDRGVSGAAAESAFACQNAVNCFPDVGLLLLIKLDAGRSPARPRTELLVWMLAPLPLQIAAAAAAAAAVVGVVGVLLLPSTRELVLVSPPAARRPMVLSDSAGGKPLTVDVSPDGREALGARTMGLVDAASPERTRLLLLLLALCVLLHTADG